MSQAVAIASDSSVDLWGEEAERRGIALASIHIALSREYFPDPALPRSSFYQKLKHEPRLPTIVAPLAANFVGAYRQAAKRGEKILCLINPFESCSTLNPRITAVGEAPQG